MEGAKGRSNHCARNCVSRITNAGAAMNVINIVLLKVIAQSLLNYIVAPRVGRSDDILRVVEEDNFFDPVNVGTFNDS
jgi:hypothetical protein